MSGSITTGHAGGLDYDVSLPAAAGDGATVAVLLHGRGSHKGDLQGLAQLLPNDWAVVTPQAPFAAAPWGYGPGWAWYRYMGENRVLEETLADSLSHLDDFLAALPDVLGFAPGPIILGGFSQGGTTSIAYAMTRPGTVETAWNFSGFVHAGLELPAAEAAAAATPIFWGHGRQDGAIPFSMAMSGRQALSEAGVPFTTADFDIGHWIVPEEVAEALALVEQVRSDG
ncbi:MAG: dienelactone hydrolase family protein [Gemmatimonadota bacterium]|nr:dienelactone hydrolase family protein [Gemmatimonadota bacterium]MDE3006964.1 dienelactone hydrolase family protein [Gemmatimonadota bacterium]MDE3014826.1 dienelactone hydrolase family protein [Gemmatimonadota bacterium]